MTILSVCREVAPVIGIGAPSAVFGADDEDALNLAALANEMGARIARAAEWQKLKVLATFTGNGTQTEFSLPADFDRFPTKQALRSSVIDGPTWHETDHDRWLDWQLDGFLPVVKAWTLLGGSLHFNPAPASGELIKAYYLSNKWAQSAVGDNKAAFTADDDVFRLDERTLRLSMIAQWRANKGMDPEPHASIAGHAMAQDMARDKGPREIRIGRATVPGDVTIAYPYSIVPE